MGAVVDANELIMNEENPSSYNLSISKMPDCSLVDAKNGLLWPQLAANGTPSVERPATLDFSSSPLTLVSCFNSNLSNTLISPPTDRVLDPFTPDHCSESVQGLGTNVVPLFNFSYAKILFGDINHDSLGESISEDDHLFQSLYSTILDAIVSEQTKEVVADVPTQDSDYDGFRTPKFARRLRGVAETCPHAPIK